MNPCPYNATTCTDIQVRVSIDPVLYMSVEDDATLSFNVQPTYLAKSAAFDLNITTNTLSGYILSARSVDGPNLTMTHESITYEFAPVSTISALSVTNTGWGIGCEDDADLGVTCENNGLYVPLNTSAPIAILSQTGPVKDSRPPVFVGALANHDQAAGTYTGQIEFSVVLAE